MTPHLPLPAWKQLLEQAAAHSTKYGALVAVLYDGALLSSEVASLTLRRLRRVEGGIELFVKRVKKTKAAWLTLSPEAAALLTLWLQEGYPDWRNRSGSNPIFPGREPTTGMTREAVYYAVKVIDAKVSPFLIRRSRVRHLIEAADRGGVFPLESVLANLSTLIGEQAAQYAVMQYFTETRAARVTRGMVQVGR